MNINDIRILYDYNYWANRQLLDSSARVGTERFVAPVKHSYGSLRGTLVHIMEAEVAWRLLCQHQSLSSFQELKEGDFPTVDELSKRWVAEERVMRDYIESLTDEALTDLIRYTTDEGNKRERVLWHCLWHVVNHGTHHRCDASAILREFGEPGQWLDFTVFLNRRR